MDVGGLALRAGALLVVQLDRVFLGAGHRGEPSSLEYNVSDRFARNEAAGLEL